MTEPLLHLEGIDKRFGQVIVAEQLDLSIGEGAAVGIVGPNGAGKSTLFGMIAGDIRPDSGTISFHGSQVTTTDAAERCRKGIGRTYQVPRPFEGMTVFENVLVAAQQGARLRGSSGHDAALGILTETGLAKQANTPAGRLGLLQRKRLEVARALATGPRLLLLDEVAGGLTDPEVAALVEVIRGINASGVTIIWIEHVVRALLSTVDRLICLAGGRLIGDGKPRDVLRMPEVRERFLGAEDAAVTAAVESGTEMLHTEGPGS